ncbi:MAG: extracellular solute-binding protein [Actinomycetota bacterium]
MGDAQDRERRFVLDRRRFLGLTGGAAAAAFLASCGLSGDDGATTTGPSPTGSTGAASPSPLPPVGGPFNYYTWEGYDTAGDFTKWFKDNGIELNTKYISGPEEVPTVLKGPGGDQWDASYGDNVVLLYFKELGILTPLTEEQVPGLAGLMPAFQVPPFKNEDGTYNAVPWTWGFSGVTYRTDRVPEPTSWHDLLDPKYEGRVSTIDSALNNVALGSLAVGIDPDTLTSDQLNGEVKEYLTSLVGQIKALAPTIGDSISLLLSGDVDYMVVGLAFMDSVTADEGIPTETIVPSEGAIGWNDSVFLTPTAPNPQNALAFMNHLVDPAANAEANSSILQGPGVQAAIPLLSKEAAAQYPFDDIDNYLSNTLTFNQGFPHEPDGDRATYDEVLALWEEVKGS